MNLRISSDKYLHIRHSIVICKENFAQGYILLVTNSLDFASLRTTELVSLMMQNMFGNTLEKQLTNKF
jgi:hypothetical protein